MSDAIDLNATNPAEHIPAVLAAPKGKRGKLAKTPAEPFVATPATFEDAAAPIVPTAAAPADPIQEDTTMATTFENTTQTATEKTQQMLGDVNSRAKDAMGKSAAMFAELNSFGKGNVEALVESGKLAFAGMQTLAQAQAAYVRKQFEEATAAARSMTAVKSPTEFAKVQGDYVRQQFDGLVAETSRSTEAVLKLAGEVVQPISNRFALAVEKVKQAA